MRTLQSVLVVSLLSLTLCPVVAQYKYYEKGFEAYKHDTFDEAITNFSEYLNRPARDKKLDVEVYYLRGLSYYKKKDFKTAIGDFEDAILLNHVNAGNIYWFLAHCHVGLGYYPDAIGAYDMAIKLLQGNKENLVKLLSERGKLQFDIGKSDLAFADIKQAYDIQPGNSELREMLDTLKVVLSASRKNETAQLASPENQTRSQATVVNTSLADFYKNERRFALVIGNSGYSKKIGELRNPVNDATDIAAELQNSNFDVHLLTDATYGQLRAALLKFRDKINEGNKDNTVALFYFAGHGIRLEEENYLIPVDADVEYEDDIWRYCFPVQKMVLNILETSNSRLNIVILDACRNNPFPSINRSLGQQGLGEMKRGRGSFIAYATAPGSVASDGIGRNGLYTQELLKAMRKPGLTIEQVFKEVRLNVYQLSGERQNTWDSSNITGEFYFKF